MAATRADGHRGGLAAYAWFLRAAERQARGCTTPIRCGCSAGTCIRPPSPRRWPDSAIVAPRLFWRDPAFFVVACGTRDLRLLSHPHRPRALLGDAPVPARSSCRRSCWASRRRCCCRWPRTRRASARAWHERAAMHCGSPCSRWWRGDSGVRPRTSGRTSSTPESSRGSRRSRRDSRPDDLVVVESRNASDVHVLALPLAYIYDTPVLVLNSPKPDKAVFEVFLGWARQHHRAVYFIGGGGTDLLSRDSRRRSGRQRAISDPRVRVAAQRLSRRACASRSSTSASTGSCRRRRRLTA